MSAESPSRSDKMLQSACTASVACPSFRPRERISRFGVDPPDIDIHASPGPQYIYADETDDQGDRHQRSKWISALRPTRPTFFMSCMLAMPTVQNNRRDDHEDWITPRLSPAGCCGQRPERWLKLDIFLCPLLLHSTLKRISRTLPIEGCHS